MGSHGETTSREFDLILVGALDFVGKLATMYLLQQYGGSQPEQERFRWGLSARNSDKLKRVHKELSLACSFVCPGGNTTYSIGGDASKVPVFYGDCDDADFVDDLTKRTRVIATSLTPYTLHGSLLVEACVRNGKHYVDISGEMLWIREQIDKHHDKAAETGVRVVHACGLGSVPADLSVYLMHQRLSQDGIHAEEFKYLLGPVVGSLGGGTVTSYATAIGTAKRTGQLGRMLTPTLLAPHGRTPVCAAPKLALGYDQDTGRWTAPLWLAGLDVEVVGRSGALLDYPEGVKFTEAQSYGGGVLFGLASAALTLVAAYTLALFLYFPPTRWLLTKLRPPGKGPNRLLREKGHGTAFVVARGRNKVGHLVVYKGAFDIPHGDPGYQETAKMLVEGALCLILDFHRLPKVGGVLTPAAAFDGVLMERLEHKTGMTFKLDRVTHQHA